jgi:hypothetical protein
MKSTLSEPSCPFSVDVEAPSEPCMTNEVVDGPKAVKLTTDPAIK